MVYYYLSWVMLSLTIVLPVLELNSICIATCQIQICIHMVLRVFMSMHTFTITGYPCTYCYNKLGKTLFVVIGLWGFQKIRYYLSCIGLSQNVTCYVPVFSQYLSCIQFSCAACTLPAFHEIFHVLYDAKASFGSGRTNNSCRVGHYKPTAVVV